MKRRKKRVKTERRMNKSSKDGLTLTSLFFNRAAFRDFIREEVTEKVQAEVFERYSDGTGILRFSHDWANGFEGRMAFLDFPVKVAKQILRSEGCFCYDAGE